MDPSENRFRRLSGDDRIVYRQWLRRTVFFYSSVIALLVFAAVANRMLSAPSDLADETMQTAAIAGHK